MSDILSSTGRVYWFTGLPSSGKSTLAHGLKEKLELRNINTYHLDGDQLRAGLNSDLGFSEKDRSENIRRAAEVAKILADAGFMVLATFISPFAIDRAKAKQIVGKDRFKEIYVRCPLAICEQRDVKGLYRRARAGELKQFTGLDSPYEEPMHPDLVVDSSDQTVDEAVNFIFQYLILDRP